MFCANCGKKIDDDALFCPHCGAKTDAADTPEEAAPESEVPQPEAPAPAASVPAPEPVTPEPASSVPTPEPDAPAAVTVTPEPTPTPAPAAAAAPPVAPSPPVTAPPTPAAATPPPASTVPPAPVAGEPAKKGSSKCWFIGCGILLVLIVLGGIGTFIAGRYAIKKGGESLQNIQQQLEDQGFQFEDQDSSNGSDNSGDTNEDEDASPSSSDDGDNADVPDLSNVDWDQISDNMPEGAAEAMKGLMGQLGTMADSDEMREAMANLEGALPKATMHMFFIAWQLGNVDEARKLMTDKCSDKIEDSTLEGGYTQVSIDVQDEKKLSDKAWEFRVDEAFKMSADGDTETALYRVKVVRSGDKWLVDELEILDTDE